MQHASPAGAPAAPPSVLSNPVSDTLRIPLAARAFGDAMFPALAVNDAAARQALRRLGDDGQRWLRDRQSVYGVLARTRAFQDLAQTYLAREPAGCLVNLGCGLSDYFQWLDNGQARMVDADLPEVIALRREWLGQPGPRRTLAELDLCQPGWWDRLGLPSGPGQAPVFLMSEGVLMYLQPQAVSAILAEVGERAPAGSVFTFDAMCWLAAGRARRHPSVRHTRAEFGWGPRRLADLTRPHPRLRMAAARKVMEGYGFPYSAFGPLFRLVCGVPFYAVYELHARDGAS